MVFLGTWKGYNGQVHAQVRISELDLLHASRKQIDGLKEAIVACDQHRGWVVETHRVIDVSVNDPNPDKVRAVLDCVFDMGIVLG